MTARDSSSTWTTRWRMRTAGSPWRSAWRCAPCSKNGKTKSKNRKGAGGRGKYPLATLPAVPMTGPVLPPMVEIRGATKRYGELLANDRVDLQLRRGEVHALLGENGAGKSTLSKILYGFIRPDAGEILLDGAPVRLRSPRDARARGIGMVFQDFMLIPALDVRENIALFLPATPGRGGLEKRIRAFGERFGLVVDPRAPVRQLPVGERQKVEILKLLLGEARVLILDEPTKVLAPHEVAALFRVFAALKAEGYAILFITHKLREVLACADRITVLRQGRVAGGFGPGEADADALVTLMFGERLGEEAPAGGAPGGRRARARIARRLVPRLRERDRPGGPRPGRGRRGDRRGGRGLGQRPEGAGRPDPGAAPPGPGQPLVRGRGGHPLERRPHAPGRHGLRAGGPAGDGGRARHVGAGEPRTWAPAGATARAWGSPGGPWTRPWRRPSGPWASPARPWTCPRAPCPEATCSGWSSPGRWPTGPGWWWPSTPPAAWTCAAPPRCGRSCAGPGTKAPGCCLISEDLDELAEMADRLLVLYDGRPGGGISPGRLAGGGGGPPDDRLPGGGPWLTPALAPGAPPRPGRPGSAGRRSAPSPWRPSRSILLAAGKNPLKGYADTFKATLASAYGLSELLVRMTPLLLTAVAVALPSRLGLINVGGEGQLYLGAWLASAGALAFPSWPAWALLPLVILLGFLGGALWAAIPGLLRAARLVNETIATLLLNYVAPLIVSYFVFGPWRVHGELRLSPVRRLRRRGAAAPALRHPGPRGPVPRPGGPASRTGCSWTRPAGGCTCAPSAATRRPPSAWASRWATWIVVALALGGGMAGLAGMGEAMGIHGRLRQGLSPGYGFTGFLISWLAGGQAPGDPVHGLPLRHPHLRRGHPPDHPGPALLGRQHPAGHHPVHRAGAPPVQGGRR